MKLKSILGVTCAATVMFASCSNEDNPNEFIKGDKDAHLNIAVAFPKVETRSVVDGNATTDELKVTNVTVFIFENGAAASGSGQTFTADKFDATTENLYTLKEENKILTTNGTKNIYVGINLPTSMQSFTTESALAKAIAVSASDLQGANGSAMFSTKVEKRLLEAVEAGGSTPQKNIVAVEVERLVAKVAVSHGSTTSYTKDNVTYTIDKFAVGQDGSEMYPMKVVNSGKLITPYKRNGAPTTLFNINANNTASNGLVGAYAIENATEKGTSGEATYAVVRASFKPAKLHELDGTTIKEVAYALNSDNNIWVVRYEGDVYFAATETIADAICANLSTLNPTLKATKEEYKGSYCYYYVYLNKDDAGKKLELHRNDFIHISIDGVNGLGTSGDTATNGETPVDPANPNEPVVKTATSLIVSITTKAWNYSTKAVTLE
ncbi:Mfa1 family fimbria major subunit [Bacteroides sp. 519]|uniref:Mfa1 family fimbria major subunit n=1 Tax=Bacteroides sp. 519 TaxID=2302937 RepID=UPI0013CFED7E|nr:Mfa1 family fimbria major subunit [Bacteroides sp. 519]NDV57742.1 hypothetical protein [Bacteroides sp. 519]